MYDDTTLSEIVENLAKLLSNTTNLTNSYFDMFFNPTPMDVTLTQYNSDNELVTYTIPNRAKDRKICLAGSVPPETNVEAVEGTFYINESTNALYYKAYGSTTVGWKYLLTEDDLLNHNASLTAHDGVLVNYAYIGDKDTLITSDKTNIVRAINTCKQEIDDNIYTPFTMNSGYINANGIEEILYTGNADKVIVERNLPTYTSKEEATTGVKNISLDKSDYYKVIGLNTVYMSIPNADNVFTFTIGNSAKRTATAFDFTTVQYSDVADYTYISQIRGYSLTDETWTILYTSNYYTQNMTSSSNNERTYVNVPISNVTAYDKYEVTMVPTESTTITSIGVLKLNLRFTDNEVPTQSNIYFKTNTYYGEATGTTASRQRLTIGSTEPVSMLGKPIGNYYVYAKYGQNLLYIDTNEVSNTGSKPTNIESTNGTYIDNGVIYTDSTILTNRVFHPENNKNWNIIINTKTGLNTTTKQDLAYFSEGLKLFVENGKLGITVIIQNGDNRFTLADNLIVDESNIEAGTNYFIKLSYSYLLNTLSILVSTDGINYTEVKVFKLQFLRYNSTTEEVETVTGTVVFSQDYITGTTNKYTEEEFANVYPNKVIKFAGGMNQTTNSVISETPVFQDATSASTGINGVTLSPSTEFACTLSETHYIDINTDLTFTLNGVQGYTHIPSTVTFYTKPLDDALACDITSVQVNSPDDTSTWVDVPFKRTETTGTSGHTVVLQLTQPLSSVASVKLTVKAEGGSTTYTQTNIQNLSITYTTFQTTIASVNYKGNILTEATGCYVDNKIFWSSNGIEGQKYVNTKVEPIECLEFDGTGWVTCNDVPVGEFYIGDTTVSAGTITDTKITMYKTYEYNKYVYSEVEYTKFAINKGKATLINTPGVYYEDQTYEFTSVGTYTITVQTTAVAEVIMCGGGGGGTTIIDGYITWGNAGMYYSGKINLPAGTYTVTIGRYGNPGAGNIYEQWSIPTSGYYSGISDSTSNLLICGGGTCTGLASGIQLEYADQLIVNASEVERIATGRGYGGYGAAGYGADQLPTSGYAKIVVKYPVPYDIITTDTPVFASSTEASAGLDGVTFSPADHYFLTQFNNFEISGRTKQVTYTLPNNNKINSVTWSNWCVDSRVPGSYVGQVEGSNDNSTWETIYSGGSYGRFSTYRAYMNANSGYTYVRITIVTDDYEGIYWTMYSGSISINYDRVVQTSSSYLTSFNVSAQNPLTYTNAKGTTRTVKELEPIKVGTTPNGTYLLALPSSGNQPYLYSGTIYNQEDEPTTRVANDIWINQQEPSTIKKFNGTNWLEFLDTLLLDSEITVADGSFTSVKQPKYNSNHVTKNKPYISSLSMPSSKYTALSLGTSGSTYTAPANGYFLLIYKRNDTSSWCSIWNASSNIGMYNTTSPQGSSTGNKVWTFARKGETVGLTYVNITNESFRFVYTEGDKLI